MSTLSAACVQGLCHRCDDPACDCPDDEDCVERASAIRAFDDDPRSPFATAYRSSCSGSVDGEHDADVSGRCAWCRLQIDVRSPHRRVPPPPPLSDLDMFYRYRWDPDWGNEPDENGDMRGALDPYQYDV